MPPLTALNDEIAPSAAVKLNSIYFEAENPTGGSDHHIFTFCVVRLAGVVVYLNIDSPACKTVIFRSTCKLHTETLQALAGN